MGSHFGILLRTSVFECVRRDSPLRPIETTVLGRKTSGREAWLARISGKDRRALGVLPTNYRIATPFVSLEFTALMRGI
jgi:hypothetical protein